MSAQKILLAKTDSSLFFPPFSSATEFPGTEVLLSVIREESLPVVLTTLICFDILMMNKLSLWQFLSVGASFEGHFETPAMEHQAVAQGKVLWVCKIWDVAFKSSLSSRCHFKMMITFLKGGIFLKTSYFRDILSCQLTLAKSSLLSPGQLERFSHE